MNIKSQHYAISGDINQKIFKDRILILLILRFSLDLQLLRFCLISYVNDEKSYLINIFDFTITVLLLQMFWCMSLLLI